MQGDNQADQSGEGDLDGEDFVQEDDSDQDKRDASTTNDREGIYENIN